MRTGTWVGVLVAAAVAVGAVVWIVQSGRPSPNARAGENPRDPGEAGPSPQAVVEETSHDFGAMTVGEKREHTFYVRNAGDAPLVIRSLGTSCSCIENLLEETEIAPGEQAPVKVEWEPKVGDPKFLKFVNVGSTDRSQPELRFAVRGSVEAMVQLDPPVSFGVGLVKQDVPANVTGRAYSRVLDTFELSIAHDDDMTSTSEPMAEEELEKLGAKCGYVYTISFTPTEAKVFTKSFTLKTDIDGGTAHTLSIDGRANGPVTVIRIGPVVFHNTINAFDMGHFSAAVGHTVQASLIAEDPEGAPFEITGTEVTPDELEVAIERDETFRVKGKSRYVMAITFPPGNPGATRTRRDPVTIHVSTNHPKLEQATYTVEYVAD